MTEISGQTSEGSSAPAAPPTQPDAPGPSPSSRLALMILVLLLFVSILPPGASTAFSQPPETPPPAIDTQADQPATPIITGSIQELQHEHGMYLRYVPKRRQSSDPTPRELIVIVHGSIAEGETAVQAARTYITRWEDFAEERHAVLLAPAFDQANYGGRAGPGGGYRGLFGRHVGADAFVNAIVDDTRTALPGLPNTFALYGHSAGGQFVSRYIVMHPKRVKVAVISAAGTYAFPDPQVTWTNGMKPLRRRIRWSDDEAWRDIEIAPDPAGWVQAVQIPIYVVVGARDTQSIKAIPGNPGRTRIERSKAWVKAMETLAEAHEVEARIQYVEPEDIGHNSEKLTSACQRTMRGH